VVIRDLHLESAAVPPNKTHTKLAVDPNAVLTGPAACKSFKMIAGRNPEVVERQRRV